MKKTDFNSKFMIDEGKTFAEWKEWVRKFKPTQAKAHVVQATLKNGKKFDRVYGSYVDAQNNAFSLKQQLGAKNVKMFTSVNGGPLKLERSFDSAEDSSIIEGIAEKYALDAIGAGVVVPSFKAKTDVFKRLAQGNGPNDFNKAKKGLLDIVETIKKEIERQKSRNIPQNQKDEILKRLNKELEEAKQSIEIYKKGRNIQPQTTKQWNRAMLRNDSADEADAAFGVKIPDNEKGTERSTMEKVFKELSLANAWKKVKKGNTIVIRTNINGKDQDVAIIQYFNPNTVSITPRKGAPSMVSLKNASVMAAKIGVEGRRSYNDSADEFSNDTLDRIKAKYCLDKRSEILVYKIFDKNSNVVAKGEIGNVNTIPWNDLRQKARKNGKPWNTISVFRKGESKAIDSVKNTDADMAKMGFSFNKKYAGLAR